MHTRTDCPDKLLAIGELAARTGIAPETIRIWERRYGRPQPIRLDSGHRRYRADDVVWLRGVAEALARGHRPSRLLRLSPEEVADLGATDGGEDVRCRNLLDRVRAFDRAGIETGLEAGWRELGARAFLVELIEPLLVRVGREWAAGRLDVRHEHFLTESLGDFLRRLRLSVDSANAPRRQARLLLATLSGERHGLGLQMLALLAAQRGIEIEILGVDIPVAEIARAAEELAVTAVAVSVSLASAGPDSDRRLKELRALMPRSIELLAGGGGMTAGRRGPEGVRCVRDLATFEAWLDSRV